MRVTTPVAGFTGEVAGVAFVDGVGETTDDRALAYFARRGFTIDAPGAKAKPAETPLQEPDTEPSEEKEAEAPKAVGRRSPRRS